MGLLLAASPSTFAQKKTQAKKTAQTQKKLSPLPTPFIGKWYHYDQKDEMEITVEFRKNAQAKLEANAFSEGNLSVYTGFCTPGNKDGEIRYGIYQIFDEGKIDYEGTFSANIDNDGKLGLKPSADLPSLMDRGKLYTFFRKDKPLKFYYPARKINIKEFILQLTPFIGNSDVKEMFRLLKWGTPLPPDQWVERITTDQKNLYISYKAKEGANKNPQLDYKHSGEPFTTDVECKIWKYKNSPDYLVGITSLTLSDMVNSSNLTFFRYNPTEHTLEFPLPEDILPGMPKISSSPYENSNYAVRFGAKNDEIEIISLSTENKDKKSPRYRWNGEKFVKK